MVAWYNHNVQPTDQLIEALDREQVEDARQRSVTSKLLLGGDLFDAAYAVTLSGIRAQYPAISNERDGNSATAPRTRTTACNQYGTRSLFEQLLVESRRFEPEQP
jgi:hypothetical protein